MPRDDLFVQGGRVLVPEGRLERADVVIRDGRIDQVDLRPGRPRPDPPQQAGDATQRMGESRPKTWDAWGQVVVPGFIDLQCNGAGGIDLAAEPGRLWDVAALLPRWGVTAWLPSIVTSPEPVRRAAMDAIATGAPGPSWTGAIPLGLHFEGPLLAPDRRGAHEQRYLVAPDLAVIEGWSAANGVAAVTLAPELPGALDVVRALAERGVVVSAGHSSATMEQAEAALDAGASCVTHLFNAMEPLHHRNPGLVTVGLLDERVAVGLIADGLHVHPRIVELVARTVGPRLILVTDAVAALGSSPGPVRFGEREVVAGTEGVRLADGSLAGSALPMDRAVANLTAFTGCDLTVAVDAASSAPARLLGRGHERGVIAPGAVGDLVLLDLSRGSPEVVATIVGGRVVYRKEADGSRPNTC